jgi:hypothetical protein
MVAWLAAARDGHLFVCLARYVDLAQPRFCPGRPTAFVQSSVASMGSLRGSRKTAGPLSRQQTSSPRCRPMHSEPERHSSTIPKSLT